MRGKRQGVKRYLIDAIIAAAFATVATRLRRGLTPRITME